MNLWNLKFSGSESLPLLTRGAGPSTEAGGNLANLATMGVYGNTGANGVKDPINVVKDFPWTASPQSSKDDVPRIQMIESRIVLNSTVTNMIYSALASADTIKSAGITAVEAANDVGAFFKKFTAPPVTTTTGNTQDVSEAQKEADTSSVKKKIQTQYQKALQAGHFRTFSNPALKPYEGLYATELTGFNYYFPYFDDQYALMQNDFGEQTSGIFKPIADLASGLNEGLAGIANVIRPGTYIEKAKQYSMGDTGRTLSFRVPLLNTLNPADISRNWQLIFGLIYQNRPGRVSKSIIDQPVIYEINIPGVAYMPYAFISSLRVNFLGNRRLMKLNVPILDSNNINVGDLETIVPDAYELDIAVTGLNEETRNFLYANVNKSKLKVNKAVEVPSTPTPATDTSPNR